MRALLATLLLLVPATAGCADVAEGIQELRKADEQAPPYYQEYHEMVAPQHERVYEAPVAEGALLLNVTLMLRAKETPVQAAQPPPAQLTVTLLDPAGNPLKTAAIDARTPQASLLLQVPEAGAYAVKVRGGGLATTVEGKDYGAAYVLSVEALYG